MQLSVDAIGLERVRFGLNHLIEGCDDLSPLFERAGDEFYTEEEDLFARAPWADLTPAYKARKREQFGDKPILRATDRLFKSLTEKDADDNIHQVDKLEAVFGSVVWYGGFHRKTRDPMVEPDVERYQSLAEEYMNDMVRKARFN